MKHFGIHARLLMSVIILVCGLTFLFGYIGVTISRKFMEQRFEERIRFLARYLSLNAELGILIDERGMLERLAKNLLLEKDVVKITILNSLDEPLVEAAKPGSFPDSVIEVPVTLKETEDDSRAFRLHEDKKPGDKIIGMVRINYSSTGIISLIEKMKIRFIWVATLLVAVSLLIFYFISRTLVSSLTELVSATRKVAKGDFEFRTEPGNLPETRELAIAFNSMLDSIKWSSTALEDAYHEMLQQKTLARMGEFSMMVAHEVKNPLGIIKSSLDILKKDHNIGSDDIMVSYIEDEIKRLNKLIEDFLLFAKPAKPHFRLVDINRVLEECAARSALFAPGDSCSIETDIPDKPCMLMADPDLLARAFTNMIKNAFEAGGEKGAVEIKSICADNNWIVEIKDHGPGIPPENIKKVFEPFFTTRSKGTGLGLAYVSQVVMAHDGNTSVENNKEGGALFRVKIPVG